MKNLITLLLIFTTSFSTLFAQSKIEGTVRDENKKGVFFATVALYNQKDSSVVKAESTDDKGKFSLKGIKDGDYYLEASMLGFDSKIINGITFPEANGKIYELTINNQATQLEAAEVVGKKPLLEQQADRLVVNVAENITNLNGNILDVMKKVPGVLVIGDKLTMAGQRNVTILIDGKTTQYVDMESLLRDMPGDNIKKVEVIHQPGAELDASGTGSVINIILKKNSLLGTNGSVTYGIGKGYGWKHKGNVSLSHYQGAVNVNASIGYRNAVDIDRMFINRIVLGDVYDQVSTDPGRSKSLRGNLGLNWDITDKHRIGFESRAIDSRYVSMIENFTNIDRIDPAKFDLNLFTANRTDETWDLYSVNPYYSYEIDTLGQKLDVDFNFVNIQNGGGVRLNTVLTGTNDFFSAQDYRQPGDSKIYVAKVDYTYPFTKEIKLQVGGKYSDALLDNTLAISNITAEGVETFDGENSDHYIFDEEIAAAYAKLIWKQGKWSGTAGLRYEDSKSIGTSVTIDPAFPRDSALTRDIEEFFPSLSIAREITKQLGANFVYSYRIDRPRYSSLNPFVFLLDPFTSERGNTTLTPAFTHSMRVNLTFEKQPFFNLEYKKTNNPMVEVIGQNDAEGESFQTVVNLENFDNFSGSLFFPLDFIPKISGYAGVITNYASYNSEYLGERFDRSRWSYTGFMQANFKLPKEIQAEVTGWFYSGGIEGILDGEYLFGTEAGISRKFMDKKLRVSLGVDNPFFRFFHGSANYANINARIVSEWDAPVVNMQVSYKFGNQHMKGSQKRKEGAAEELNRAGKN